MRKYSIYFDKYTLAQRNPENYLFCFPWYLFFFFFYSAILTFRVLGDLLVLGVYLLNSLSTI